MERGNVYLIRDLSLKSLTKVLVKKMDTGEYSVVEVLGKVTKEKIAVVYIEKCANGEDAVFHKVSHRGSTFYIFESKLYGNIEWNHVPYLSLIND
jgi:hypothetical protein